MKNIICLLLILFLLSCTRLPAPHFEPNDAKPAQIFSIDDIIQSKCLLKTGSAIRKSGAVKTRAKKWVIEANKAASVVFSSKNKASPPVINNLPYVKYTIQGPPICEKLIGRWETGMIALPHSVYKIYFQVAKTYLRFLIQAPAHQLPYYRLTSSLVSHNGEMLVPLGGYQIIQGYVGRKKNIDNIETHILDFFSNKNQPYEKRIQNNIKHWVRKNSSDIYIPRLNEGFKNFKYKPKMDVLPKSYFEGVWYYALTIVAVEPLYGKGKRIGSGIPLSMDSYLRKYSAAKKIYFQFESNYLKAFNEYYREQGKKFKITQPVESEILSLPVEHLDYRPPYSKSLLGLSEYFNTNIPWNKKQYAAIDFSKVDHTYNKYLQTLVARYGLWRDKTESIVVKEIRFAEDYFDFVVYDGYMDYRFAFRKVKPSSYQPKTMQAENKTFQYLHTSDDRVLGTATESFKEDLEKNILLPRVHVIPGQPVSLYFSSLTPEDKKIRAIGREAVSLWNQALGRSSLKMRLKLDESRDVNVGDNRYHIINIPSSRYRDYGGVGIGHVDHNTGELIASAANTIIPDLIEGLEFWIMLNVYNQYGLTGHWGDFSSRRLTGENFSLSRPLTYSEFESMLFQDKINQIKRNHFSLDPSNLIDSIQNQKQGIQNLIQKFSFPDQNIDFLKANDRFKEFKILYALRTGQFIENENIETIKSHLKNWNVSKWTAGFYQAGGGAFGSMIEKICPKIPHPIEKKNLFKKAVKACADKIYPIYALATTVHEIGHTVFSLGHNFAGSADKKNFNKKGDYQISHLAPYLSYKDQYGKKGRLEDLFPPVSSSVMEYSDIHYGEQWHPGEYDISAVEFLYDGDSKPEKDFMSCSPYRAGSSTFCQKLDFGSSPEEIAMNEVQDLFHILGNLFYSVDRIALNTGVHGRIRRLMTIYYDWRSRLNDYVSKLYPGESSLNLTRNSVENLIQHVVEKAKTSSASKEDKEFLSFYRARNLIYHALTYLAFTPNHYCILKKPDQMLRKFYPRSNRVFLVEISKINKEQWPQKEGFTYGLTSCFTEEDQKTPHPIVQAYIDKHYRGAVLEGETGYPLYPNALPKDDPYLGLGRRYFGQHQGSFIPRATAFASLTAGEVFFPRSLSSRYEDQYHWMSMMQEKDIQKALKRLILARMTKGLFYSDVDFFQSLKGVSLEDLTPEKSAEILFQFPPVKERDIIFRDEFIQPEKLKYTALNPHKRNDRHNVPFFQNFSEERLLMHLFNLLYKLGHLNSGGYFTDKIVEKTRDIFQSLKMIYPTTAILLHLKAVNFKYYHQLPENAASNYFETENSIIFSEGEEAEDSWGRMVIGELGQNSVRTLFIPDYEGLFTQLKNNKTGDKIAVGFFARILEYLRLLMRNHQGIRLGRFHFIYSYILTLGFLDSYSAVVDRYHQSPVSEINQKALELMQPFIATINGLFFMHQCKGDPTPLINYYNFVNKTDIYLNQLIKEWQKGIDDPQVQKEHQRYVGYSSQVRRNIRKNLSILCPSSTFRDKGKMQVLFKNQELIVNNKKSLWKNPFPADPQMRKWFGELYVPHDEKFFNSLLRQDISAVQDHLGPFGVYHIHQTIFYIFQKFFPFQMEPQRLKYWVQAVRQTLIDVIPKLMLMYSYDRDFVREMMYMAEQIYTPCFNGRISINICKLQVERIFGYYFRKSPYLMDPQIEEAFEKHVGISIKDSDIQTPGIPLKYLINRDPVPVEDQLVNWTPLDGDVLSDWLFYERGWEKLTTSMGELKDQKELLLDLLFMSRFSYIELIGGQ